jgi:hypothetical protein
MKAYRNAAILLSRARFYKTFFAAVTAEPV